MSVPAEEFDAVLQRFVARRLGDDATDITVSSSERAVGGQSRENWPFDVSWRSGGQQHHRRLFLRRDPQGSVLETDRRAEFEVLSRLADQPVLSPEVVWLDADGSELGRPSLVMTRYDGRNDHFVLEGGTSRFDMETRLGVASQMVDLLVAIHALDWRAAGLDEVLAVPVDPAAAAIEEWTQVIARQSLEPQPVLALIERWLWDHKPPPCEVTMVHGDVKPGNVLLDGDRVQVLLDWETVHLGDPTEDVGWVTNPVRRREHLIPDRWEVDDLVGAYEERTGRVVDRAALRFWQVLANYKLAAITLTGVRSFCDHRSYRVWTGVGLAKVLLAQTAERVGA